MHAAPEGHRDYRGYRHYDIRKYWRTGARLPLAKMAPSRWRAHDSGLPEVRAAVLAQAFRQFEKSASLRLMMIDGL